MDDDRVQRIGPVDAGGSAPAGSGVGPRDWYRQGAGFLLGTATGSMFFNLFSNSIGYRGVALVALAGGLVALVGWLRRHAVQAPRAPLVRAAVPVFGGGRAGSSPSGREIRKVGPDDSARRRPDLLCEPPVSALIIRNLELDATVVASG
ncbi:hypothetical protein [Plantactinospora sonchi]|uniref:MFS transporter n=1 Tax=Plantactinospora sonchi TaxID=1544735 RepID=A0ABU7RRI4_9ACTN